MPDILHHHTCTHGAAGIEADGFLRPHPHPLLPELGAVVWLIDPAGTAGRYRGAGLSSHTLECDRTEVCYPIFAADVERLLWWPFVQARCDPAVVADLNRAGLSTFWWLSQGPVPVRSVA